MEAIGGVMEHWLVSITAHRLASDSVPILGDPRDEPRPGGKRGRSNHGWDLPIAICDR
jgi:hypothetical protein